MEAKTTINRKRIRDIALIGVMTAITCIIAPFSVSIPASPAPISLTNLAIYFSMFVLGAKNGTISYCVYLLIGAAGYPVFSGFGAGIGKLLGPTGGYLIGFIPMAIISGIFIEKFNEQRPLHFVLQFIGMALGTLICYAFGTAWLAFTAHMGFGAALMAGVAPFVIGDTAKIVVAIIAGNFIRKALSRA